MSSKTYLRVRSKTAPLLGCPRLEPPASQSPLSTVVAGEQHYLWSGIDPETIYVYSTANEEWKDKPTTGCSHPTGLNTGGCTSVGADKVYTFGGVIDHGDTRTRFNDLCELDLGREPYQWTKIQPKNNPSEWPPRKEGCGLVPVDEDSLGCFGGFCGAGRWTSEFHLFNLKEGVWSSPHIKGLPPRCSHFSFTKIDRHRAVLFGGFQPDRGNKVNDVYLFDFINMEATKIEPVLGEPWPVERERHAACCLNYDEEHPVVLVYGGEAIKEFECEKKKLLGDMWMLDVDSGKWTEVKSPMLKPVKPRCNHSITASRLAPGLTEVLMFGGQVEWFGNPVAETTILRFGESLSESTASLSSVIAGKWSLINLALNNNRGFKQRIEEKDTDIIEANNRTPLKPTGTDQSLSDQVASLKKQLLEAKQQTRDEERRADQASMREQTTQYQLKECQRCLEESNIRCEETEKRIRQELIAENGQLQGDSQEKEPETQWVIEHKEIQMTERELGTGGWGVVKVAKFRGIEVAAKTLHQQLQSNYRGHFIHEMNMAARMRHPKLVQFIGATLDREMIVIMELMHTSLRRVLEGGRIPREHIVSIAVQVCQALNYLHLMQPDPVIHRDMSSANVLLDPLPNNCWRAKVTDYGTMNTLPALRTKNPGNPVYAAPEASTLSLQTTKMDIFSVGVLLIEMCIGQLPSSDRRELDAIQDRQLSGIIKRCINHERDNRPTASELLYELA